MGTELKAWDPANTGRMPPSALAQIDGVDLHRISTPFDISTPPFDI